MNDEQKDLKKLLARLPDKPVASNFTSRVMAALEAEEARSRRKWNLFAWNWHRILPRVAVASLAVVFVGLTLQYHQSTVRRERAAESVILVSQMPNLDVLKNFDAIQRMSQPAKPDEELLALASEMK